MVEEQEDDGLEVTVEEIADAVALKFDERIQRYVLRNLVFCLIGYVAVSLLFSGCRKQSVSVSVSTTRSAAPENTVLLEDGQSLELLEDITVKGRIPFSGDELYTGNVGIKKGTMIVKPRMDGPVKSTPVPPEIIVPLPMTREEKVKRFQLAESK